MLPFPSDFYMEPDSSTGSGQRVAFGPTTLPENIDHTQLKPDSWNELDGFSTLGEMVAHLSGATLDGVVGWQDLGAYADADVKTVVVNVDTGQRLPHFVERDVMGGIPERELLVLRPVEPMDHAAHYVVGIRGLVDDQGQPVAAPQGFAALRDGTPSGDPDIERQRANYEDRVFPALQAQGFSRDELQLAWSFTTVSKQGSLGRALWVRDDALAWADKHGLAYTIDDSSDADCSTGTDIGRTIHGHLTVPLYLTEDAPGSVLTRDDQGWPYENGTRSIPWTVRIPCTLMTDPRPGAVLQYGHGLLSTQSDVNSSTVSNTLQATGSVALAVNWTGMASADSTAIALMIVNDPSNFAMIPERLMQGYMEALLAERMLTGPLAQDPLLTVDGTSLIDPKRVWFLGVSQGSVLGGGFAAYSPDVSKVVLLVPGTPFTLLLARSVGFSPFLIILENMFDDPADVSMIVALMQSLWDPGESAGYAHYMNQEPLDDITPPKDVLLVDGVGDALVTSLGAHVMARSYGAKLIVPSVRDVWGVEAAKPPFSGSAILEMTWGDDEPVQAIPANAKSDVHNEVPRADPTLREVATWLNTGLSSTVCDGPCDPD